MDFGAIKKNIAEKGLVETIQIRRERQDKKKENARLKMELDEFLNKQGITEKRGKEYRLALKRFFIKQAYPRIYSKHAQKPIENKIVFMERGSKISPSLKYMRDYVKEHTDYEIVQYTLMAREVSDEEYYMNAKEYVREIATAKAVFICTANALLGHVKLRPETTYIQLWHGCGAFKKIGLSTVDKRFGKSAESHEEFPLNTGYSYVTIASPEVSWIFEEAMGIKKEDDVIVPTGISRTDCFFDKQFIENAYQKLYENIPQAKGKKVILYAPTFRGTVAKCTSPDVLDVKMFAENLNDEYILIFKHHQTVKILPEIPGEYEGSFAFDMTRAENMDINELMIVADICISDYSSVVFEYSLLERPMIFFTYDIEDYIDERGLYYKFSEVAPGPMFKTNEEIIDYIKNIDELFDKRVVTDFKNKFMCCCDGHSSERILELIRK